MLALCGQTEPLADELVCGRENAGAFFNVTSKCYDVYMMGTFVKAHVILGALGVDAKIVVANRFVDQLIIRRCRFMKASS